jgi:hypothetical protein
MTGNDSIFFDINLPNAPTWFYFSALLAVALFFKFSRLLSVRNWDVLTLYLPVPGLLLLAESSGSSRWGYLWLMAASGYFFLRCLVDLALVRRPALAPNLTLGGLVWLMAALFVSLIAVAARQPNDSTEAVSPPENPIDEIRRKGQEFLLAHTTGGEEIDPFLQVWLERGLTLVCHLAVIAGLVLIGWRHFDDLHAGAAASTFYLLLPYTYLLVPGTSLGVGRWDHAWPMALMVWAVLAYRRPATAGAILGLAAGSVFFPALTLPVWLSFYRGRGAGRFLGTFVLAAGLCRAAITGLFLLNGELPTSLRSTWRLSTWLPWREPPADARSFWQLHAIHYAYRLPVFIAYFAFALTTLFWPSPKNLAHVLALSAAVLIGIQFWYADQGGVYVLWYLPFLLLVVFRPNLTACQPAPVAEGRLVQRARSLGRAVLRRFRPPEPAAGVRP